jgi:hypothetical protein
MVVSTETDGKGQGTGKTFILPPVSAAWTIFFFFFRRAGCWAVFSRIDEARGIELQQ